PVAGGLRQPRAARIRPEGRPMRHRAAPCVAAAAFAALIACSDSSDRTRLVGTLERDRIELAAEFAEPLVAIEVREGERVAPGQVLARQETRLIGARVAQAEARAAAARQRLTELETGARIETIDEARARLAAARAAALREEREFTRIDRLV